MLPGRIARQSTLPGGMVMSRPERYAVGDAEEHRGAPGLPDTGARIGQYELIRELGRGGMGAVFLARDTRLGRRVAIKFLQSDVPELTARFILEARATARCHHENIIVIHDVGEHWGNPYMVLELLEGTPLDKLLAGGRTLPPARAVELVVPVMRALVRAHEHGIVHRDLKPDNIFLTDSGTVKVLDFGIAKLVQEQASGEAGTPITPAMLAQMDIAGTDPATPAGIDSATPALTGRGALIGTIPFMSPEQWMGEGVDHRTDLWAVGILLFRMVAGRHPLHPLRGQQLMVTAMLDEPMPRVRSVCPQVPDELAAIIDQCLIKPKEQRIGSARALLDALEPLLPGRFSRSLRADECPYAGLSSFQEADAGRFFGRTREIATAVARLRDQPLLGIVGPSGAGKSSFVRAGLVPAVKQPGGAWQSGEPWTSLVLRPGRQPVAALAHLLAPMLAQDSTMTSTATVAADLAEHRAVVERLYAEPGYLGAVLRSRARHGQQNIMLFVDQFEELYTLVDDARERLAFTACLASVADDATAPLRVVISIRSDFLDRVPEDARFMAELGRGLHFLLPPDRAGLRDALIQPAEMAGYAFESPAMVEHMLDHLEHTPGALPLLQFAATKLWDLRDTTRRLLTEIGYQQIGGITGALASHADAVLAELSPQAQALARGLLLRLVTPERTRAIVSMEEIGELPGQRRELDRLVDHLVHARLLVVQTGGGAPGAADGARGSVEIVHESLIHGWPLLARWLDENQDDAAFLEQLRNAARQWEARGRPTGLLWRGEAMEEAQRWHRRFRGELPAVQQAYLQAVFALATRSARTRRVVLAGVIGVLIALVAAAAVALVLIGNAEREAKAQAREAERQLERARAAEAEARDERERAVAASAEVARGSDELARKNTELVAAVQAAEQARKEAEAARARAETSKQKARKDRRRAEDKEGEARDAEAKAREANARLQDLLAQERRRIQQLERQGATHAIGDIQLD